MSQSDPTASSTLAEKKATISTKVKGLLKEFSEGKLSSEQFNILYERYQSQLEILSMADGLATNDDINTIAIRRATQAVALGMAIYHHKSGTIIETLGNFDLLPAAMSRTLNEISDKMEQRAFMEPIIQKNDAGIYVVYTARDYTTAVLIFRNEPAQAQLRDIERLLHDFEEANTRQLQTINIDKSQLARPFLAFIKKKMGT